MVVDRRPIAAAVVFGLLVVLLATLVVTLTPWHLGYEHPAEPVTAGKYFTPSQIDRSEAFHDAAKWPAWLALVANLVTAALIGFGGLGRRAVAAVRLRLTRWWTQATALVCLVLVIQLVVTTPFAVWSGLVARRYGLSTRSWAGWVQDRLITLGIALVVTSLCVVLVLALARWSPRRWWLPASAAALVAVFGLSFVYPVVVEPAFYRFTSMPETPVRSELLQMASQDGLDLSDVLVADASRRTSAYNAYVSGLGPTRRLVVYDNMLRDNPDSQVRVIVAHELGHARNHDVLIGTTIAAVGAAAGIVGLFLLLQTSWWRSRVGAGSAGDPAVVPLVLSLVVVVGVLAMPLVDGVSRRIEARADLHALQLTDDPTSYILVQQGLATNNLAHLTPDPALSWWFDTHPTVLDRIAMGVAWQDAHGRQP
jgi:STE24 endopeptidase